MNYLTRAPTGRSGYTKKKNQKKIQKKSPPRSCFINMELNLLNPYHDQKKIRKKINKKKSPPRSCFINIELNLLNPYHDQKYIRKYIRKKSEKNIKK